jgi:glucan 1,3-beta-glucosidase
MARREPSRPKHRERATVHEQRRLNPRKSEHRSRTEATDSYASEGLSADSLAKLNQLNDRLTREQDALPGRPRQKGRGERQRERNRDAERDRQRRRERRREYEYGDDVIVVEKAKRSRKKHKRRVVSGALLEEGDGQRLRGLRGGDYNEKRRKSERPKKSKKKLCKCWSAHGLDAC